MNSTVGQHEWVDNKVNLAYTIYIFEWPVTTAFCFNENVY